MPVYAVGIGSDEMLHFLVQQTPYAPCEWVRQDMCRIVTDAE
jgi:hypothetical protein